MTECAGVGKIGRETFIVCVRFLEEHRRVTSLCFVRECYIVTNNVVFGTITVVSAQLMKLTADSLATALQA